MTVDEQRAVTTAVIMFGDGVKVSVKAIRGRIALEVSLYDAFPLVPSLFPIRLVLFRLVKLFEYEPLKRDFFGDKILEAPNPLKNLLTVQRVSAPDQTNAAQSGCSFSCNRIEPLLIGENLVTTPRRGVILPPGEIVKTVSHWLIVVHI